MPSPPSLFSSHRLIQRSCGAARQHRGRKTLWLRMIGEADANYCALGRALGSETEAAFDGIEIGAAVHGDLLDLVDVADRARGPRGIRQVHHRTARAIRPHACDRGSCPRSRASRHPRRRCRRRRASRRCCRDRVLRLRRPGGTGRVPWRTSDRRWDNPRACPTHRYRCRAGARPPRPLQGCSAARRTCDARCDRSPRPGHRSARAPCVRTRRELRAASRWRPARREHGAFLAGREVVGEHQVVVHRAVVIVLVVSDLRAAARGPSGRAPPGGTCAGRARLCRSRRRVRRSPPRAARRRASLLTVDGDAGRGGGTRASSAAAACGARVARSVLLRSCVSLQLRNYEMSDPPLPRMPSSDCPPYRTAAGGWCGSPERNSARCDCRRCPRW